MNTRCYRILTGAGWVLLPSFLVAVALDIVYFEVFDPVHPPFIRNPLGTDRVAAFLHALVLMWGFTAAGIALSMFLSSRLKR